ncbi:MAG: bifunctional DNA primase/polymerase, partial [Streptosporangiales bacterium]
MNTRRPDILACALWLQRRLGAFVFAVDHPGTPACTGAHRPEHPCDGSRGKHPCGRWSRDSTTDPAAIRVALGRGLRNLGIDCGKSGLLVVDEDRRGAFSEYAAGIVEQVPETFTVTTSKGHHFYFAQPAGEPLGNSPGQMAGHGIDIRGAGGFVVAPGSIHATEVLYAPADSAASVLPAPAWLVSA